MWPQALQNVTHRNFTQPIPRGSQRRAHASSECHQVRSPSEIRQRTSTPPALRFDCIPVSLFADIWTAWVSAPCSSHAVRLLSISRQARADDARADDARGDEARWGEGCREPSSGSAVRASVQSGWGRFDKWDQLQSLKKEVSYYLEKQAKSNGYLAVARGEARITTEEFVADWLLKNRGWPANSERLIKVYFADEPDIPFPDKKGLKDFLP